MDEPCGAAYLRLLALPPLRLLTGLRPADGAWVPRWLLPPSPRRPGSENNQWLPHFQTPSPLVTPARRMLFRPPTSSSPWAPWTLRLSAPLLPRPFLCSCVHLTAPAPGCRLYPLLASPPRAPAGGRTQSIRAGGAAGARLLLPGARRADARRQRGERDGGKRNKTRDPRPFQSEHPHLNNVPSSAREPTTTTRVSTPLGSAGLLLLLARLFCSVLDRPPSVPPAGRRSCSRREDWLSDRLH